MFPGIRTVFRSRWNALFWAAGILWLAYDVAGSAPSEPDDKSSTNAADMQADTQQVEKLLAEKF